MQDGWMILYGCLLLVSIALLIFCIIKRRKILWVSTALYDLAVLTMSVILLLFYNNSPGRFPQGFFCGWYGGCAFGILLYISLMLWAYLPKQITDDREEVSGT